MKEVTRRQPCWTKRQTRGRTKILQRVLKGKINIIPADNEKSIEMIPINMYQQMFNINTGKDEEETWTRLEEAKKAIRSPPDVCAKSLRLDQIMNQGMKSAAMEICHHVHVTHLY